MDQRALIPTDTRVVDRTDVSASSTVRLQPDDSGFQVEGPGMVDTVLVRAQSPDYAVRVETNNATPVADRWTDLETIAADLTHVSAYQDGDVYVTVVQDYPYQEFSAVSVRPAGTVTFDRLRAEWILGLPVS